MRELVAVLSRWPNDEAFAFEPTQVVGGLPTGVGPIEQGADEPSQGGVIEAGEQVGEPRRWRTSPPSPVVRRSARRYVLAFHSGWPGHLGEGPVVRRRRESPGAWAP